VPSLVLDDQPRSSRQRPHRSAVTWSDAEQKCLDQLMTKLGLRKDARLLRRLVLDRCLSEGIDIGQVEAGATGRHVRRAAA